MNRGYLVPLLEQTDISLVPLVALTTPKDRIKLLKDGENEAVTTFVEQISAV